MLRMCVCMCVFFRLPWFFRFELKPFFVSAQEIMYILWKTGQNSVVTNTEITWFAPFSPLLLPHIHLQIIHDIRPGFSLCREAQKSSNHQKKSVAVVYKVCSVCCCYSTHFRFYLFIHSTFINTVDVDRKQVSPPPPHGIFVSPIFTPPLSCVPPFTGDGCIKWFLFW